MTKLARSFRRILLISLGLLALFACHITSTQEQAGDTFSFPTLKDKVAGADHVNITLKDTAGNVVDVLFNGPVDSTTSFKSLAARNYTGGKVVIDIEAKKGDAIVYSVERTFDASKGGNLGQVVLIAPNASVTIARPAPRIREGETAALPAVTVQPADLADKTVQWHSRDTRTLVVEGGLLKGVAPGSAVLVAVLRADTLRSDTLTVTVLSKDAPIRILDSLHIEPESLTLAVKGPSERLRIRVSPTGAPDSVHWSSSAASVATVDSTGLVKAAGEGQARIIAVSKADPAFADTLLVKVLPEQKVDSVRFERTSLDLFAGGAGEPLDAAVYPILANQAVQYSIGDATVARVEGSSISGLKEGETFLIVKSIQDPTKADTLTVTVFPAEKVDSVRLAQDSVKLYINGETQLLTASIHPATLQSRFLWRSADDRIVQVDAQGRVSPKSPGKAYVSVTSRADGTKRDSTLVIVRQDVPRLKVGGDTIVSAGTTVTHRIVVTQDYGLVTQFKADLNGDGIYEDSSTTVPASRSFLYDMVKDYSVRFYVRDTEGNDTVVVRLVKAVNGRVVQITSPQDGSHVNQTPITVSWIVDGTPQSNTQSLNPGENTITREARDSAGKVFTHTIRVTLDQTAPNRPSVKGPAAPVNTLTPTWTWSSGGGGGNGTFRYRLDNPDMSAATVTTDTFHTAAINLTQGAHTLYVDERDEAGNWSPSGSAQVRIDTTAPAAPSVTVTPSGVTNNRRPTWSWTVGNDAMAQYRFKFGNDDFRTGGRDTTATSHRPSVDLGEGSHTLYVQVRDTAGNWSRSGSATVTIDVSGPAAPTVSAASALTNDPTPTWTWSTTTAGTVTFRYRFNNPDLSTGATVTTEKSYTHPTNLVDGTYTLYVQEGDAAGNWSPSGSRQVQVDMTAPQPPRIDSTPLSPLNTLRPRWTWRSGSGGAKVFKARVDNPDVDGMAEQSDSSFTPGADLAEGWRTLYVKERDAAGNWSAATSRRVLLSRRVRVGNPLDAFDARPYLKVNLNNVPYAVYTTGDGSLVVKSYTGTWNQLGVIPSEITTGSRGTLEIETHPTSGYPIIGVQAGWMKVIRYTGTGWDTTLPAPDDYDAWGSPSYGGKFTLNHQGEPMVAFTKYISAASEYRTYFRRHNGLTWVEPYPFIPGTGSYQIVRLLFDAQGSRPYIVYQEASSFLIMTHNGNSWSTLSMTGLPSDLLGTKFEISQGGVLHCAGSRVSDGHRPMVYRYTGARWDLVGTGPAIDEDYRVLEMSFGPNREPVLAAESWTRTFVAAYRNSKWIAMGGGVVSNHGELSSISVSKDNVPYLGFSGKEEGGAPVVHKWSFEPSEQ